MKAWLTNSLAVIALLLCLMPTQAANAGSPKRGFAGGGINNTLATNAGWFYHWGLDKPNGAYDAKFVPMFWGGVNQAGINKVLGYEDTTHVLGFNEPERADQANLSVADAISKWQTLETGLAGSGIKLVSPAVSDTGTGQQWLSGFMSQANNLGLQVDAVAFHWYGVNNPNNPVGAANQLLGRVDSYHNTYGKPIWLTEFALHDWGGNYSDEAMREANRTFLEYVIPRLEARSYVESYSFYQWFSDAMLIEGAPLKPTIVGDAYIPSIETGETFNLAGQSQGDDRVYMKGGTVTNTGVAAPDAVRYLDVISGANTLTGTTDWGITSPGWVTVRDDAILRKVGNNELSISGVAVANQGSIDFLQGTTKLQRGAALVGTGTMSIGPAARLSLGSAPDTQGVALSQITNLHGGEIISNPIAAGMHSLDNLTTVHATATFLGAGTLRVNGPLVAPSPNNQGAGIVKDGVGTLLFNAVNTYAGNTTIKAGTLEVGVDGSIADSSHIEVQAAGVLDVSTHLDGFTVDAQTLSLAGQVVGSLNATSGATVVPSGSSNRIAGNLVVSDATVRVGGVGFHQSQPTRIHIDGDYSQQAAGTVELDLLDPETHDALAIGGHAALAGTLLVDEIASFAPEFGDAFTILTATGGISGAFDTVELPTLNAGQVFLLDYSTNAVRLTVAGSTADYDYDGDVDDADLALWQQAFGAEYDGLHGNHFLTWQREFTDSHSSFTQQTSVPEPRAVCYLLLGGLMLGLIRFPLSANDGL